MVDGFRQGDDDLGEAAHGGVNGPPHLLDLPLVLDQPQLRQGLGQRGVGGGVLLVAQPARGTSRGDGLCDRAVGARHDPHLNTVSPDVLAQGVAQLVDVSAAQT